MKASAGSKSPPRSTALAHRMQLPGLVQGGLNLSREGGFEGGPVRPTGRVDLEHEPALEFEAPAIWIAKAGIDREGEAELFEKGDEDDRNGQALAAEIPEIQPL